MSVFVIAEAGSSHDNEPEKIRRLIQVAADAGADACKFQFWSSAARLAERRKAPQYEAIYAAYQLWAEQLPTIKRWCDAAGIEFMVTAYLPEDIEVVAPLVHRFKVASFEAGDHDFLRAHLPYGKPIIVSTGMQNGVPTVVEDPAVVPALQISINHRFTFLACVSAYPCPVEQANLAVLHRWAANDLEGYSDHTRNTLTGALAVAAGASILEVHFRLPDTDPANPDYATALTPAELTEYVRLVRLAEVMLGDGIKKSQPAEAEMSKYRVQP